jgi:hypothetical protein
LLLVWCLVFIAFVTSVICATIYGMHKNRLENALKRELLERGMSAEEIATVIRAKPGQAGACRPRNS